MGRRQSDIPILPKKPLITVAGRGIHNNTLSEDTFTVLRDGAVSYTHLDVYKRQGVDGSQFTAGETPYDSSGDVDVCAGNHSPAPAVQGRICQRRRDKTVLQFFEPGTV